MQWLDKRRSNTIKNAVIFIVHLLLNMITQINFLILYIWYFDYSLKNIVFWTIAGVVLIGLDYSFCILLERSKTKTSWLIHCIDLLLPILAVSFYTYGFVADIISIVRGEIVHYSAIRYSWLVGMIIIDIVLICERRKLIKRNSKR